MMFNYALNYDRFLLVVIINVLIFLFSLFVLIQVDVI